MKKLIAVLMCIAMLFAALPAFAEGGLAGGWQDTESAEMTPEATAALDKALEGFVGSKLEPVALLSTQVVAGINYCILCRVTPVVPNARPHYTLVYVYADLQGGAEILDMVDVKTGVFGEDVGDEFPDYDMEPTTLDHYENVNGATVAVDVNGEVYDLFVVEELLRDESKNVVGIAGHFARIACDESGEYSETMPGEFAYYLDKDVKGTALNEDLDDVAVDVREWLANGKAESEGSTAPWSVTVSITLNADENVTVLEEMYTPWG